MFDMFLPSMQLLINMLFLIMVLHWYATKTFRGFWRSNFFVPPLCVSCDQQNVTKQALLSVPSKLQSSCAFIPDWCYAIFVGNPFGICDTNICTLCLSTETSTLRVVSPWPLLPFWRVNSDWNVLTGTIISDIHIILVIISTIGSRSPRSWTLVWVQKL